MRKTTLIALAITHSACMAGAPIDWSSAARTALKAVSSLCQAATFVTPYVEARLPVSSGGSSDAGAQ